MRTFKLGWQHVLFYRPAFKWSILVSGESVKYIKMSWFQLSGCHICQFRHTALTTQAKKSLQKYVIIDLSPFLLQFTG